MAQAFDLPPAPLREDAQGVIRAAGSRVTLDSLVALFDRGATAEEIVQSFPTLALADIYAILDFVVRRRETVDTYLARRRREDDETREDTERRAPSAPFFGALAARKRSGER